MVSLMKYLTNKELTSSHDDMQLSSKRECEKLAYELFDTFFRSSSIDGGGEGEIASPNDYDGIETNDHDLAKQLSAAIEKETQLRVSTQSSAPSGLQLKKLLHHELVGYEKNSVLGDNLQKLLSALKSIQPTFTESERVFSLAASICTKKGSRLSDRSLNNICFLKSYFLCNQK